MKGYMRVIWRGNANEEIAAKITTPRGISFYPFTKSSVFPHFINRKVMVKMGK